MDKKKVSFGGEEQTTKILRRSEKSKTCNLVSAQLTILPSLHFSVKTFQNPKYRETMEDMCLTRINFLGERSKNLFCLFDGHGGDNCVNFSVDRFPDIFGRALKEFSINVECSIKKAFNRLDKETKDHQCLFDGTTLTCVYLSHKILYCANVGDSSCIIVTNDSVRKVSYDHKCTDENEIKRIILLGGKIVDDRIDGIITITRSIGDHELKGKGLTCEPHIYKQTIGETDKYIILASDGVWDVVKPDDILNTCKEYKTSEAIVEEIVNEAVKNGTTDNVSCIVVSINKGFII